MFDFLLPKEETSLMYSVAMTDYFKYLLATEN